MISVIIWFIWQQDNGPDLSWQQAAGLLLTVSGGIFGFIKWFDSRKTEKTDKNEKQKETREEWLIDHAFEMVDQLRAEVDRVRKEAEKERDAHMLRIAELQESLNSEREEHRKKEQAFASQLQVAYQKIGDLERALTARGD